MVNVSLVLRPLATPRAHYVSKVHKATDSRSDIYFVGLSNRTGNINYRLLVRLDIQLANSECKTCKGKPQTEKRMTVHYSEAFLCDKWPLIPNTTFVFFRYQPSSIVDYRIHSSRLLLHLGRKCQLLLHTSPACLLF